jgi:ribosomal-protein-alanine N-acetyltransferase
MSTPGDQIIETPRLLLRQMQPHDLDALLQIFGDPQVMAAFGELPFDHHQMNGWLSRNLAHQKEHGYGLFAVVGRASGLLIGDCGLEWIELAGERTAELGYDFRSDVWNQGFATEAAGAVRDYAFATIGLPRLVSLIRVGNLPSRRVAEKIGMRLAATIESHGRSYWVYEVRPDDIGRLG